MKGIYFVVCPEKASRCFSSGRPKGFALVVTLSLLVLLSVIAVGLLSLSSISMRSAAQGSPQAEARANARLALTLAIGELQKSMGIDQRISAPSGIFDANPDTADLEGLAHTHLTGVWDARDGSQETLANMNSTPPDYSREASFRRWLVSNAAVEDIEKVGFAQSGSLTNPVLLLNSPKGRVSAGRVPVKSGSYAWWVGDENCKAQVNARDLLAREDSPAIADLMAGFATPGAYGLQALAKYEAFPANSATTDKYISRGQMDIDRPQGTNPSEWVHDVTTDSASVLANVTTGSLRKDLSLYLERKDITWLAAWKKPDWTAGPLGPNNKIALSPLAEYDVLAWKTLHHYYNMHRQVSYIGNRPTVAAIDNRTPAPDPVTNPEWNSGVTSVSPVVVRMQYLLSYGVRKSGTNYILNVYSYPVATLWNPFNVDMNINGFNIFLHNLPIEHVIYRNGTEFTRHNWKWGQNGSLIMRFGVPKGSPAAPITLKAGEQKIFNYYSTDGGFTGHNMTESPQPWHTAHAGRERAVAGGTINNGAETDRIAFETLAGTFETSGQAFVPRNFQSSFEVRTEPRGDHNGHPERMKLQGFSSVYAWRFEGSSPRSNQLSRSNFPSKTLKELTDAPTPFCLVDVRLKPLDEVQVPNKTWLHSIPSLTYVGATSAMVHGTDTHTPFFSHPYSVSFDQRTAVQGLFQTIPYMGSSYTPSGQRFVADREVPQVPLSSLAQLQNLPQYSMDTLHWGAHHQQNHAIGNSYASPGVPSNKIRTGGWPFYLTSYANSEGGAVDGTKYSDGAWTTNAPHIDRSYAANHLLWDEYFFSSIAPQTSSFYTKFGKSRSHKAVADEFFKETRALPNAAYIPYLAGKTAEDVSASLVGTSGQVTTDGHLKSAAHLMVSGGFNINSTSVPAWTVLLASSHLKRPVIMDTAATGTPAAEPKGSFVVSRFTMPIGGSAGKGASEEMRWRGYRELTAIEITQLAEAVVRQVKKRGPFRSLGEFINRRLASDSDETALYGALQAALEDPKVDINKDYRSLTITDADISATNYAFKKAALGSRFQGTPAYISQADILQPIAPVINARSDTFLVRGYGESLAADGTTVLATARCEAVVQRYPDYVNPADKAEIPMTTTTLHPENKIFGRRFTIKSFRWLSADEI